ncbi:MAG: hypothetical protein NVV60_00750 [Luteimonas sp.]|nr:hypothetical protein [Luteimonas sp.]
MLTFSAALSIHASACPPLLAWLLSIAILAHGALAFRKEGRRPRRGFVFHPDGTALVDGLRVDGLHLAWRGPLAFVTWLDGDGRRHRLAWWPDTLPAARRRELRLAAPADVAAGGRTSVAP